MNSHSAIAALVHRVDILERRQRLALRGVLAVLALGALAFAGWAPLQTSERPQSPSANAIAVDDAPAAAEDDARVVISENEFVHRDGDEPYVPSRLEWLAVRASAQLPGGDPSGAHYAITYSYAGPGSNTLLISAIYDAKRADRAKIAAVVDGSRRELEAIAAKKGWSWMQVRVEMHAL